MNREESNLTYYPLRDGLGFISLEDWFGGDEVIVEAARICYQSESKGEPAYRCGCPQALNPAQGRGDPVPRCPKHGQPLSYEITVSDGKLIRKLLADKHNTPFEHAVLRWHVKCPIFIARQWIRHRMGTFNERSLRYTRADLEYYWPPKAHEVAELYWEACGHSFDVYDALVNGGVPKEQARGVLPLATYTEFMWTVNVWSFVNWLTKRSSPAAQWEHRQYAKAAYEMWLIVMPATATAWHEGMYGDWVEGYLTKD